MFPAALLYHDLRCLGQALVNHSCEPNCWAYFENGRNVHVRTLRAIAPGKSEKSLSD